MRRSLVLGNWKMNGASVANHALLSELIECLAGYDRADVGVCPPFPYLSQVVECVRDSGIAVGAQNASSERAGAFTGEVSVDMLADLGCRYVLAGHSERRSLYGESDGVVAAKVALVLEKRLTPVLCVGETLSQREADQTLEVVGGQLAAVLDNMDRGAVESLVVAYEPVWAIGTGRTATPAQAQAVHSHLRRQLQEQAGARGGSVRILYGGSVNAANAAELFAMADIDGALVGGASLVAADFAEIVRAAGSPAVQ